jgi:hypothetical protein
MIFKNGFTSASKKVKERKTNKHPKKDKDEENDDELE